MVEVREVTTKAEGRLFIGFGEKMYRGNIAAPPDLLSDEASVFNPKKNPTLEFCKTIRFLAFKDGECVGRIAGIYNPRSDEKWNKKQVRFTRVDFIDDGEVSDALFSAVEKWGRENFGAEEIIGPMGFTDLDQEGMLIEGFDRPGPFFTIYNAPYYVDHMRRMGYEKDVDWYEYRLECPEKPDEKIERISSYVLKRFGLTLYEPKTKLGIVRYISQVFGIINSAYSHLYGMVELNEKQMKSYRNQFFLLINPKLIKFILDKDGKLVGFGFGIPSLNDALIKSRGRLFPFGWARILSAPYRKTEVMDLYLIGVLPEWKNRGLTALLIDSMTRSARKKGIKYGETGPELESNTQIQAMWDNCPFEQHKKRRSWKKKL